MDTQKIIDQIASWLNSQIDIPAISEEQEQILIRFALEFLLSFMGSLRAPDTPE